MENNVRKHILEEAERAVNGSREHDYGSAESNFGRISQLWSVYLGTRVDPKDVAAMMVLLKISRIKNGNGKEDNWVDIAGYAACGAELCDDVKVVKK